MKTIKHLFYISILVLSCYTSNGQDNKSQQINITNFTAHEKDNKLSINWETDGTVSTNYFKVQQSEDGQAFKTVAFVLGHDPRTTGDRYQYVAKVKTDNNNHVYFRLLHIATNGDEQLSKIIEL
jgi:hypothetical protein